MTTLIITLIILLLIELLFRPRINSETHQYYNETASSSVKPWYYKKHYYLWINNTISFSKNENRKLLFHWCGKSFIKK